MGHLNVHGWGRETKDLKRLIIKSTECDLFGINETWIRDKDDITIDGYHWISHRRQMLNRRARTGSGGVGIFIADHLYQQYDIQVIDKSHEGILAISLSNKVSGYKLSFITAYLPPDNSLYGRDSTSFFSHLTHLVYMCCDYDAVYLSGDLNARVGNKFDFVDGIDEIPKRIPIDLQTSGHGEALLDFCNETKFCIINGRIQPLKDNFTSISSKGSSVVDYFLTSHDNLECVIDFEVITMSQIVEMLGSEGISCAPSKISDHSMLVLEVKTSHVESPSVAVNPPNDNLRSHMRNPTRNINSPHLPPRFKIQDVPQNFMTDNESKAALLSLINQIEQSRDSQQEINTIYDDIVNLYICEMKKHFHFTMDTPSSNKKVRFTRKPWWNEELTSLFKDMKSAEHNYLKSKRKGNQSRELRNVFKHKQDIFDKTIKRTKRNFQRSKSLLLEEVNSSDPNAFWNYIKELGPKKKKNIPWECYTESGELSCDKSDILDNWKNEFEKLYNPSSGESSPFMDFIKKDNSDFDKLPSDNSSSINLPFSKPEVSKVVNRSKNNKAPGIDGIVYDILKNEDSVSLLTKLFNLCFASHKVPHVWIEALISPIPKSPSNDPRIPLNYRGISLLSVISKLYTSALNMRLTGFAEDNKLIVNEQNGFRSDRSCLDHIFSLHNTLRIRNKLNAETFCAFIDFKKAFDLVNRDALLYKLRQNGVFGNFYQSIKALYEDGKSCVRVNTEVTDWFDVTTGVRQGDSLSPTLFSIYLNDLAEEIINSKSGIMIDAFCLSILLYADDIALIAPTSEKLQSMLNIVSNWCEKWGMQINVNKTQILHVRNHQRPRSEFQFHIGDSILDYTDSYKYLGYTIHEHLIETQNMEKLTKAASRSFGRVHSIFKNVGNLGIKTYETLFDSYVDPIMNYASGVWGYGDFASPQVLQNRIMRFYLGIHKFAPLASTKIEMDWIDSRQRRWLSMLRLFNRINSMDSSRIPRIVFDWDSRLGLNTWCSEIKQISNNLKLNWISNNEESYDLTQSYNSCLEYNRRSWSNESFLKPKLRTFVQIHDFDSKQILVNSSISRYQRSLLSQLKFGILPLKIETDRYQGIPPENRICKICDTNTPEDELHFLFSCPALEHIRHSNTDLHSGPSNNDNLHKLKEMFIKENLTSSALFVERLYRERQKLIYK